MTVLLLIYIISTVLVSIIFILSNVFRFNCDYINCKNCEYKNIELEIRCFCTFANTKQDASRNLILSPILIPLWPIRISYELIILIYKGLKGLKYLFSIAFPNLFKTAFPKKVSKKELY